MDAFDAPNLFLAIIIYNQNVFIFDKQRNFDALCGVVNVLSPYLSYFTVHVPTRWGRGAAIYDCLR